MADYTSRDDDRIFVDGDGEVRKTLAARTGEIMPFELRCTVDGATQIDSKALEKSSEQKLPAR